MFSFTENYFILFSFTRGKGWKHGESLLFFLKFLNTDSKHLRKYKTNALKTKSTEI